MKLRNVVLAALMVPLTAGSVQAQAWKWDFGVNAGYARFNKLLDAEQTGLPDDSPAEEIKFAAGPIYGAQLTFWPANWGLRLNARYGSHDIKGNDLNDFDFVEDVNLWAGTLDLMLRLGRPADEFQGMEVLPFIAAGAGLKWHNPGYDNATCNDPVENKSWSCGVFTPAGATGPTFGIGELKQFMGHLGLGADWRLSRGLALRTEISDQIYRPRVNQVNEQASSARSTYTLTQSDNNVASVIHELAGQVGLHFLFGVPRPAAVAVVAPPAPPVQQPTPVVERPVERDRESTITVCVIDPTVAGGIRMQTATWNQTRGDTLVDVNGQRVLLRNAVGNVMVASNADWYVRGQPLTMTVGSDKYEFVTTGSATMVNASDLAFLGTINGMAVYASRDEVKDIQDELNDLHRAQRGGDLSRILGEHKDVRDELQDVKVFYVPLQPTGCVFQAVQRTEAVRKNR